ncbi:MAG TPA: TIGR03087 family PEP-CTERM/XrtA system glycosyltransferase [Phycisphaeraceae bacterium]
MSRSGSRDCPPDETRQAVRRVLMLAHRVPYPPDRGDRIRGYHLLRELARHFEVSLACLTHEPVTAAQQARLQELTTRLAIQPMGWWRPRSQALAALLTGQAITPNWFYSPALARTLEQWHQDQPFDAVLTYCTGMIRYARELTADESIRHVLDLVDVDSRKWAAYARTSHGPLRWVYALEAHRLRRIEAAEHDRIDALTIISEAEAKTYRDVVSSRLQPRVVGNGVDLDYFHPQPQEQSDGRTILFVGMLDYKPNVDGIVWFAREVMPRLRLGGVPEAQLRIVGRNPSAPVRQLGAQAWVEVVGPVEDVRPHLAQATAVVAPLLIAPGVQNKVLEAMASARAVVCSPQAAAGIDAQHEQHLLVASQPEHYAQYLARLLREAAYRQQLAQAARQRMEERYAWSRMLAPMIALLRDEPVEDSDR